MISGDVAIIALGIVIVLAYDLINGFHDAANSIATVVSTHVLHPVTAVLWAAFFNLIAMFIFSPRVAETVSKIVKIGLSDTIYIYVVLIGVLSAMVWSLLTWWIGLPISSSHALIGGVVGAGVAHAGLQVIEWDKFFVIISFIVLSPLLGFILGAFLMFSIYWLFRKWRPVSVDTLFRKGQLLSAALYSIGHGANDAQKMMGMILALLVAGGRIHPDTPLSLWNSQTAWIILSCQSAMAIGTALGGWRIVKTMGMKITKLKPVGGFCAESGGAFALFLASYFGVPVSTTHTIVGAIIGVGAMNHKISNIRWNIARQIVWAWVLTIPLTAGLAALLFWAGKHWF